MPTPLTTDPELVRDLQAGRRDAFVRLYGEYHAPIYNLCARVLGDREEAKDVTQEVFIKAFNQLPSAGSETFKLRPWLYRVATNACFNQLRSRRKLDDGGDAGLEHAASGIDEFERAQTVALVEQSLGEMNERYRTALVLKDLQGLPPEEIAEVMEVSRANADVLVHRARASFKMVFAKLAGSDAAGTPSGAADDAAAAGPPRAGARAGPPRHPRSSRPRRRRPADQDRRRRHDQGRDRRGRRGHRHRRRRGRGEGGAPQCPAHRLCGGLRAFSWSRASVHIGDQRRRTRRSLGRSRRSHGRPQSRWYSSRRVGRPSRRRSPRQRQP
jgi:RNA polymerase sigma-70 factor (ECF subfamily)